MSDLNSSARKPRAWLEENCPASMRDPSKVSMITITVGAIRNRPSGPESLVRPHGGARLDRAALAPKEYGGGGLDKEELKILRPGDGQDQRRRRSTVSASPCWARRCSKFGNEEQKLEHLPKIARGEIPLVPGLLRAQRGLRPRQPGHPG